MMTVWKYSLLSMADGAFAKSPMGQQAIQMPENATVIRAGRDGNDEPCVWAIVNTDNPLEYRRFEIVPTGSKMEFEGRYIGSIEQSSSLGWFIFHVFEVL